MFVSIQPQTSRNLEVICPFPGCLSQTRSPASGAIVRNGFFFRTSDQKWIQRFHCNLCERGFSEATTDPCYGQKKRQLNEPVAELLTRSIPLRGVASCFGIRVLTVQRKLKFLAAQARLAHRELLGAHAVSILHGASTLLGTELQFDELETFEHTKCKPVSVPLIVHAPTRLILAVDACSMPAKGLLAAISREKYGPRRDLRRPTLRKLFESITPFVDPSVPLTSDSHPFYPEVVRKCMPASPHRQVISRRGCIVGQGELKKVGFDPLFSLNHTCAMFRAHVSRLVRKTWNTTKRISALQDHLSLYAYHHNERIIAKLVKRKRLSELLPAVALARGIA